jgi:hypothetical protein
MALLNPNEINNTYLEPVLGHRFIMYIEGIPTALIRSVDGIGYDDGEVTIDHINTYYKTRAKRRYNDITVGLYNFVAPGTYGAVYEWARLGYEPSTGRAGYFDFYAKDVTMKILGPLGDIVAEWTFEKCFPKSFSGGAYDYSNDDKVLTTLVLANSGQELNFG